MKISRGPATRHWLDWAQTDSRSPSACGKQWSASKPMTFDVTIDKSGDRHSSVGVRISEEDILALHGSLMRHYKAEIKELRAEVKEVRDDNRVLADAFRRLYRLLNFRRYSAPNDQALIEAVEQVADHFAFSWSRKNKFKPKFSWVKWKDPW